MDLKFLDLIEPKVKIFQCSPPHTGSTVLSNILQGFVDKDKPLLFGNDRVQERTVIKSHDVDIDKWVLHFDRVYKIYFVCSDRFPNPHCPHIDKKYRDTKTYPNVIIFDYEEISTNNQSIETVVNRVYKRLKDFLPIELDREGAIERITKMEVYYEENMVGKPFELQEQFYRLHGSHKNRNC